MGFTSVRNLLQFNSRQEKVRWALAVENPSDISREISLLTDSQWNSLFLQCKTRRAEWPQGDLNFEWKRHFTSPHHQTNPRIDFSFFFFYEKSISLSASRQTNSRLIFFFFWFNFVSLKINLLLRFVCSPIITQKLRSITRLIYCGSTNCTKKRLFRTTYIYICVISFLFCIPTNRSRQDGVRLLILTRISRLVSCH